jgi:hypothetical protein
MGYYVEWQGRNTNGDFWRGVNYARKKERNYQRGKRDGRRDLLRSVLRFVQIAIMVVAGAVIIQGCYVFVTLRA